jgi:hypothetical protein
MTDQIWAVVAVVTAAGSIALLRWAAKALARQIVYQIGDTLENRWGDAIDAKLAPLKAELAAVKAEVTVNAGNSLKDRVMEMQRQLEQLITSR